MREGDGPARTGATLTLPDPKPVAVAFDGSAAWGAIHRHRLSDETPDFVASVAPSLPCGVCRAGWLATLEQSPPDLSSDEAWFAWTIAAHNAVNRKLDRPEWTLEQARERWPR